MISSLLTNFIKLSKYTLFSIICQTIYTILTNIQEKVRHTHTLIEIELCQFLTTITYNHHFIPTIISSLLTYFSSLHIQVAYSSKALWTVLLFLVNSLMRLAILCSSLFVHLSKHYRRHFCELKHPYLSRTILAAKNQ